MKSINKSFIAVIAAGFLTIGFGSCTDDVKFGDSSLEKAPGGDATIDTVFNNAEYTRQFLAGTYALQYYGLPYCSSSSAPLSASYWTGKIDALSDCWHMPFTRSSVNGNYYTGTLTASTSNPLFGFTSEKTWELIRACNIFLANIGRTPDMEESEKQKLCAEAKCLKAYTYYNMFRMYGGLPIIDNAYAGTESSYSLPRRSVESTVNYMVDLLDDAAKTLPWQPENPQSETGRWTKAAAMALKCKILQIAASPLFNADKPYYSGKYEMADAKDSVVWYGNYDKARWTRCRQACDDFFAALRSNGYYKMYEPTGTKAEDYRYAFRMGYASETSTEVIFGTRVSGTGKDSKYTWANLTNGRNERYAYSPTQEYVEMFPWADGKPFNWNEAKQEGKLDQMFVKGDTVDGKQELQHVAYTRDPRLYETVQVNGDKNAYSWTSGATTGNNVEAWVGGSDANTQSSTESSYFSTGYGNNKYVCGTSSTFLRKQPQWVVLSLNDMYLTYAEAVLQADNNFTDALKYVDIVRARVGLKGLNECNPSENLTSNKENLINEILRERACELGMSDSRYFDLMRYKRGDLLEKPLHGLRMYRMYKDASGKWVHINDVKVNDKPIQTMWWNGDKKKSGIEKTDPSFYQPTYFDYERFEIKQKRCHCTNGFDVKWYLQPLPTSELNKKYGLVQNPGW